MNEFDYKEIIALYGWQNAVLTTLTSGLINHTWKVTADDGEFILQKMNGAIFQHPEWIDENICRIADYLKQSSPDYLFTAPIQNIKGETIIHQDGFAFRAFAFQKNTHTISVVNTAVEAKEAAQQFALFTQKLNKFSAQQLRISLPNFHNLTLRFAQFEKAIRDNNSERAGKAVSASNALLKKKEIVEKFQAFINHPDARLRVTHHDTKISNVLFNDAGKGVCVIDLDTVMPGHYFSDAGDMFRTYLSHVSEEEANLDRLFIRKDILNAIENGYLNTLKTDLSLFEIDNFYLSGEILIYMQSIRFLTDYLQNDLYYGKKYPDHNLVRAQNQLRLLELYQESIR